MTASPSKSPSKRLKTLRKALSLSQRELAREFRVSAGAVALWETGARPVPGTVLMLVELYEQHLEADLQGRRDGSQIRSLSSGWTKMILRSLPARPGVAVDELRGLLTRGISSYLEASLSTEIVKKKIQLALAERLVRSLGVAKGLPMKAAQLASYMELGLPPELRQALSILQTTSPPMAPSAAARVIYEELGKRPSELFAEWEPRPLAAASIGQVHRARLKSGQPVAVKIQYPGMLESIERDLRRASLFHELISVLKPKNPGLMDELRQRIIDECDYEREAENQSKFAECFQADPDIIVPKVFPELSRKRVLTMELLEGVRFQDFLKASTQEGRNRAGELITRFHTQSVFKYRMMHADPHPGNYLFFGSGRDLKVGFLDFGRVAPYTPGDAQSHLEFYVAIFNRDRETGRKVFRRLDIVRDWARFDFDAFWDLLAVQQAHHLADDSFRFTPEHVGSVIRRTRHYPQKDLLKVDAPMLWSNCIHFGLWSILADLRCEADWRKIALDMIPELRTA